MCVIYTKTLRADDHIYPTIKKNFSCFPMITDKRNRAELRSLKSVGIGRKVGVVLLCSVYILGVTSNLYLTRINPDLRDILFLLTGFDIIIVGVYLIIICRIVQRRLFKHNVLFYMYAVSILFIQVYFHKLDMTIYMRLCAYIISGFFLFVIIGQILYFERYLLDNFLKFVAYSCAFLGATAIISNFGAPTFFSLPFSDKFHYGVLGLHGTGGILEHPNTLGTEMLFGIGCSCYLFMRERKYIYLILLAFAGCGLLLGFHRGPWLAFFLAVSVCTVSIFNIPRRKLLIYYSISALMVYAILFGLYEYALKSDILYGFLRIEQRMSGRGEMWPIAIELIEKSPYKGYGFLSSDYLRWMYVWYDPGTSGFHNVILDTALGSGMLVCFFYVLLLIIPFLRALFWSEDSDLKKLLIFITAAILVSVCFVNYNIGGLRSTSMLVAILLGVAYNAGREKKVESFVEKKMPIGVFPDYHLQPKR